MQSSHEQGESFAPQYGISIEELSRFHLWIATGSTGTVTDDYFVATIEPKGRTRQYALFFAGKQDGSRITEDTIVSPRPVQPLLEMFQRIVSLEPGIEHAMGEQNIGGLGVPQSAPCAKAVKAPNSIHNRGVVLTPVGS